jgi:hypothetical protein
MEAAVAEDFLRPLPGEDELGGELLTGLQSEAGDAAGVSAQITSLRSAPGSRAACSANLSNAFSVLADTGGCILVVARRAPPSPRAGLSLPVKIQAFRV